MRHLCLLVCLLTFCVSPALGQSTESRVMVIQPDVKVRNRDGREVSVTLGQVLRTSVTKPDWYWIPRLRGWLQSKDALPLAKCYDYFTTVIRANPTAQAYHHRALALVALDRRTEALSDFNAAIGLKPNSSLYINRGNAYRDLEKQQEAIRDYNQALQLEPRSYLALNNRGLVFSNQGKYDQAQLDFDAALRLKPDFGEALNHRGVVKWRTGKPDEAISDYEAAIKLGIGLPEPYRNMGIVAQSQDKDEKAIRYYRKALEIDRDFVPANNDLAWLLATTPEETLRNPDEAVKYATRACALTKMKKANMIDTLSAALAASGQFGEAIKRIDQAIGLSSKEARPDMETRRKLYVTKVPFIDRN